MLVEDKDDLYGRDLNSRYRNCTNGFWNPNPNDQTQRKYYVEGSTYEVEVEPSRNPAGQDVKTVTYHMEPLEAACVNILLQKRLYRINFKPYGENEVGAIFLGPYGEFAGLYEDAQGNPRWYTFDGWEFS